MEIYFFSFLQQKKNGTTKINTFRPNKSIVTPSVQSFNQLSMQPLLYLPILNQLDNCTTKTDKLFLESFSLCEMQKNYEHVCSESNARNQKCVKPIFFTSCEI